MKTKCLFIISFFFLVGNVTFAQIKLFSNGGIAIGATTDPGTDLIKFYNETSFNQNASFYDTVVFNHDVSFNDDVIFDQTVILNDGTNLFESYWGGSGGGLTIPGTAGVLSMYPSSNYYKFNTSKDFFIFDDKVQCSDGLSVTPAGTADFYSTTTFNSTVNFGQYGTMTTTNFYGDVRFQNANTSAEFQCVMPAEFSAGLTVYNYLTVYGSFNNYSDLNLKTNIANLPKGSLEKILSVQGVTYNFKTDVAEQTPRAGFIAQDIQKIFPDLVVEEKEGLAIKTLELIPYLVEALKEQQEQIEALKSELNGVTKSAIASVENPTTEVDQINENLLFQNTPNPFNEQTKITYQLSNGYDSAILYVYNLEGKQIKNFKLQNVGYGELFIEGGELDAGMYIYNLIVDGNEVGTKRMVLTDN